MPGDAFLAFNCAPYRCDAAQKAVSLSSCDTNDQCLASTCAGHTCGFRPSPACSAAAECASGFCAQGVCCDNACVGPCLSCALPNTVGHCTAVPAGAPDPSGTCQDQGAASCRDGQQV